MRPQLAYLGQPAFSVPSFPVWAPHTLRLRRLARFTVFALADASMLTNPTFGPHSVQHDSRTGAHGGPRLEAFFAAFFFSVI
jgi:hypothetical protein